MKVAERRMISKKIVDTDIFTDMPITSRLLYYELNWRADDDGFVSSPKKITRAAGCSDDDLRLLIAKRFIIPFESGIILISDWRVHNYIQKDRYKATIYNEEKDQVITTDSGSYTKCIQDVSSLETQVRLGKDRLELGKDRLDKTTCDERTKSTFVKPTLEEVSEYCKERNKGVNPEKFINHYTSNGWMVGKNKMKDWKSAVRTWENSEISKQRGSSSRQELPTDYCSPEEWLK